VDLFADEILRDPYPTYAALRAAGRVVHLPQLSAYVLPRYDEVREALGNHTAFSSASGVGFNPEINLIRSNSVIASDPPRHDILRNVLASRLAPRALRRLRSDIERQAQELVDEVVERGSFDAVANLARRFTLSVVVALIGLPEEVSDRVIDWADGAFNSFGPLNDRTSSGLPMLQEQLEYLASAVTRDRLTPGSMGAAVYEAADRGEIEPASCLPLMSAYLTAGMDTTINAISSAVWLFGRYPEQWDAVRADRSLAGGALNEVVRLESPVQVFARVLTRDYSFEDVVLGAGERVALLYGSANRDERKWEDPERFDVARNPVDHLAFGYGLHGCAGQGLARMEASAILSALAERVARFELGDVERRLNNVIRGLSSVPVTVQRA
jgi:cytochrome P450